MEKSTEKKAPYGKTLLAKALKERLSMLTRALGEADVGGKGIDIVKEIKELHVLLDALSTNSVPRSDEKQDTAPLVVVWGTTTENMSPASHMSQTPCGAQTSTHASADTSTAAKKGMQKRTTGGSHGQNS